MKSLSKVATFALAMLQSGPLYGNFSVCNQTFDVLNVAVGQYEYGVLSTAGWWTIGPNQCANVIDEVLRARYIYVFAQDVFGNAVLSGAARMCIAPRRFDIQGQHECLIRGFLEAPFHEVDTLNTERWTLFLQTPAQ